MKLAMLIALSVAVVSVCNGQQSKIATRNTFRWNVKDSQELDRRDRISQLKSLSVAQRKAILDAILRLFQPATGEENTHTRAEWLAIAADTRIKLVDLNGDGVPEVIAQADDDESCSPTGNCPFWVLMKSGESYLPILAHRIAQTFTIQRSKSNGFNDIVLGMHGSATQMGLFVYRFSRGRYQECGCYNADWVRMVGDDQEELKEPDITPCKR